MFSKELHPCFYFSKLFMDLVVWIFLELKLLKTSESLLEYFCIINEASLVYLWTTLSNLSVISYLLVLQFCVEYYLELDSMRTEITIWVKYFWTCKSHCCMVQFCWNCLVVCEIFLYFFRNQLNWETVFKNIVLVVKLCNSCNVSHKPKLNWCAISVPPKWVWFLKNS
jgi:hypothetical protein